MYVRVFLFALICMIFSPAMAEKRLALIITNADYPKEVGRLTKTHADGRIIATALQDVGFDDVRHVKDADFQTTRLEVARFIRRIKKAGPDSVVFFYYSGHGAADRTSRGENFLIPVKAPIQSADELPVLGLKLADIIETLERVPAKVRFAVIDACRNVAFPAALRSAAKGFVPIRSATDILVSFSTKPGQVARDSNTYSRALAKSIRQPGISPYRVFKLAQIAVARESKGSQVPWIEDGLLVEGFRFKTGRRIASAAPAIKPALSQAMPSCDGVNVKLAKGTTTCIDPGSGESFKDCDVCPEMIIVPAGNFVYGAQNPIESEFRSSSKKIGSSFAIGKFEIKAAEFIASRPAPNSDDEDPCWTFRQQAWRELKGTSFRNPGYDRGLKHPISCVTWEDAVRYVRWLSDRTSKSYRLPSEVEWEYAARAGNDGTFWTGHSINESQAHFNVLFPKSGTSKKVGTFPPNA